MSEERSRAEEIIHEFKCGGFTEEELDDIQMALDKLQDEIGREVND